MDYKKCAIEDLRKYNAMVDSLSSMKERIESLYDSYKSVKCSTSDATPVKGGGNMAEERLISNIVERDRLQLNIKATQRMVNLIDKGLNGLDEQERRILTEFYITGSKRAAERLAEQYGFDQSMIYRFKDRALEKLTISMYGIINY